MRIRRPEDLAALIRGKREELGISQITLAKQLGVSRGRIQRLEGGDPSAALGTVFKALRYLNLGLEHVPARDPSTLSEKRRSNRPRIDINEVAEDY